MKYVLLFFIFLFLPLISAEITQTDYHFIIEENGNSVVAIELTGSGELTIPIQSDATNIEIDGGLYIMENNELTIAIGTTGKAIIAYKTNLLTEKSGEEWKFLVNLEQITNKQVTISMPENTIIKNTEPLAQIESGEITNIHFINPTNIEVTYYFSPYTQPGSNISPIYFVILIIIATILIILTLHNLSKNKKITGRQKQILQTLTDNELRIIKLLLELRKPLRRSFIEKKLEIAKSSLATTLQNLERKKLIILDKTYTTHIIKLEEWFKKL